MPRRLTKPVSGSVRACSCVRSSAALTWTTVILTLGFTVLAFSNFRPNMLVGLLGAIMIALAWVADLLVMPAFLSFVDRERAPALEPFAEPATDLAGAPAE